MMGPSHRVFGALVGAGWASQAGLPWRDVAVAALVATATSNGPTSPDVDQMQVVKRFFGHRGLIHWWGLPLVAWVAVGQYVPEASQFPFYALILGWASHLLGDLIFGTLPVLPFVRWRVGLGLDTDGFLESGKLWGRKVLPVSPLRIVLVVALGYVLWATPTITLAVPALEAHR